MNNYAIARVFTRIGDLMEIKGENPFKIKAYRNAAQTMQELTESLEVLAERGELQTVPGIGEAIAGKTQEILQTGTCSLYERLKTEVPESLIELLGLPAFGPKKIQTVWREAGVRTLDELERAAEEQRLRAIPGMAAKSEEKLLQSIRAHRLRTRRVPIGVALPYGEALVRMLRATAAFTHVEIAGSLRRRKDTIGNINLAAAAADPAAALEAFVTHSEVERVVERSEHFACVLTHNDTCVDLEVSAPDAFPALLQRRTGSPEHNARLAALARSGDGPIAREEPWDAAESFEDALVYRALGLPWIAPELREDGSEVDAAVEGRLPVLIRPEHIRGILHAHSTWSDGAATIARLAEHARSLGYSYHGNTDHSQALSITNGLNPERLVAQMAEIDALNATFGHGFRVLKGLECDILADGTLDLPVELLDQLDVVVASVHSHQKLDRETMTARVVRALESGVVDILAHPTGRLLGHRDAYELDMERVMDAALAHQVALEINAFPDRLDLNEVHARRAKERGLLISLNTDAHRPEHLSMLRYGIGQARRAWLEPDDVINTWPLDRLMAWLHGRSK